MAINKDMFPGFDDFLLKQGDGLHKDGQIADDAITKTINYVAGGAVALSVTFYLYAGIQFKSIWFLILAWAFLILALVINVLNYEVLRWWTTKVKAQIDEMRDPTKPVIGPLHWHGIHLRTNKTNAFLVMLNHMSIFLFVAGLLLLGWFLVRNVLYRNEVSKSIENAHPTLILGMDSKG
jgi:hypothetical protein